MSKVLVIQPHKMLQQALVIALDPDYQLQFAAAIPADAPAGEFVGVIVDAAALEETSAPAADALQTVFDWQLPMVVIEGTESPQVPERAGLVRIKRPIGKDSLRLALAQCLNMASAQSPVGQATPVARLKRAGSKQKAKEKKPKSKAGEEKPDLIELVDVVEEP